LRKAQLSSALERRCSRGWADVSIAITAHPEGATLAVRAQPGARKKAVMGEQAGALKVAVTAPPQDGRANAALVDVLSEWLGLKPSWVELIGGATNRNKVFLIRGVTTEQLMALIELKLA
jgi:uncharacterized protein (TIGR00251 family)